MSKKQTYFEERIYGELGATPEQNKIDLYCEIQDGVTVLKPFEIFASDVKDNIDILVYTLDRELVLYHDKGVNPNFNSIKNGREQIYFLKRIKNPKEGQPKYQMPKGQGTFPFIPPHLVEKFEKKEQIDTLVLTEGWIKAFKAAMHGLDIIGLSSITHYANSKTKQIHPDIARIIVECKVKNVIVLYDGDCLNPSHKDLADTKNPEITDKPNLAGRPNSFLSAILSTRELLSQYDVCVYFSHILSTEVKDSPKGLDDLLVLNKGIEESILLDLKVAASPSHFFYKLNVSSFPKKLQPYFGLSSADKFYEMWGEYIGTHEFNFHGTNFVRNEKLGKCEIVMPKDVKNLIRVGDDYFDTIPKPNIFGDIENVLVRRKKTTIVDDFGKDIIKKIPKYKAFVNIPSHTNYQRIVHNCYNKYSPIPHEAQEGEFTTIETFIRHIFADQYELGLDYLQILYQYPQQMLPILALVSKENQTGKSTFLNFLKIIFEQNCAIVGNAEISSEFNSFLTTRLLVCIDETSIDKRATAERIKMLSTSNKVMSQGKGVDYEEVDHFAKYVMTSNYEDTFIHIREDDIRYWVIKVPRLQHVAPNMLNMLYEEIPALLFYLNNRKISVPKTSRMWFDEKLLETDALRRLKDANRPAAEKKIREYIREKFLDFEVSDLLFSIKMLQDKLDLRNVSDQFLKVIIVDNLKLVKWRNAKGEEAPTRPRIPYWKADASDNNKKPEKAFEVCEACRPYVFYEKDFLTATEIEKKYAEKTLDVDEIKEIQKELEF